MKMINLFFGILLMSTLAGPMASAEETVNGKVLVCYTQVKLRHAFPVNERQESWNADLSYKGNAGYVSGSNRKEIHIDMDRLGTNGYGDRLQYELTSSHFDGKILLELNAWRKNDQVLSSGSFVGYSLKIQHLKKRTFGGWSVYENLEMFMPVGSQLGPRLEVGSGDDDIKNISIECGYLDKSLF